MGIETNTSSLPRHLGSQSNRNSLARQYAIKTAVSLKNLIPATVNFESAGFVLIIGNMHALMQFHQTLLQEHQNKVTLLCLDGIMSSADTQDSSSFFYSQTVSVEGFLGAFDVKVDYQGQIHSLARVAVNREHFDLVVDLTKKSVHTAQLPPLGYYAVGRGLVSEHDAISAIADTIGVFDKPKFFSLDNTRCAHYSRGIEGCTRCIDSCPANALSSINHVITINPYLCQGVGSCATACPTEAIQYALPAADVTHQLMYDLIMLFREKSDDAPVILFYAKSEEPHLQALLPSLPTHVIPLSLEELASVGLETWLTALVYGASQVILAYSYPLHQKTHRVLEQELAVATSFLHHLHIEPQRVSLSLTQNLSLKSFFYDAYMASPIKITGTKRETVCEALDALHGNLGDSLGVTEVPNDAPYGCVSFASNQCTLCMACVAVCPTKSLQAIGDRPGLTFREQDCVQCGLCQKSCPEGVITLEPRYNWDKGSRQQTQILHEEDAARCLRCDKAFAPKSMINMLKSKLQMNSHFQGEAIQRLSMCEDCRVRDIFTSKIIDTPENQLIL